MRPSPGGLSSTLQAKIPHQRPPPEIGNRHPTGIGRVGGDCLYKIAHSWLDPVINPVQTALGCPPSIEALAYPINGAER